MNSLWGHLPVPISSSTFTNSSNASFADLESTPPPLSLPKEERWPAMQSRYSSAMGRWQWQWISRVARTLASCKIVAPLKSRDKMGKFSLSVNLRYQLTTTEFKELLSVWKENAFNWAEIPSMSWWSKKCQKMSKLNIFDWNPLKLYLQDW